MLLRKRGPSTEGVFRKPCNNRLMKDVREQLDAGSEVDLDAQPVNLLVGLLKVTSHTRSIDAVVDPAAAFGWHR